MANEMDLDRLLLLILKVKLLLLQMVNFQEDVKEQQIKV